MSVCTPANLGCIPSSMKYSLLAQTIMEHWEDPMPVNTDNRGGQHTIPQTRNCMATNGEEFLARALQKDAAGATTEQVYQGITAGGPPPTTGNVALQAAGDVAEKLGTLFFFGINLLTATDIETITLLHSFINPAGNLQNNTAQFIRDQGFMALMLAATDGVSAQNPSTVKPGFVTLDAAGNIAQNYFFNATNGTAGLVVIAAPLRMGETLYQFLSGVKTKIGIIRRLAEVHGADKARKILDKANDMTAKALKNQSFGIKQIK